MDAPFADAEDPAPQKGEVTALLAAWTAGDPAAIERLMPLVYAELRAIAGRHMRREPAGLTLQATAVVHEAYLRLVDQTRAEWKNRGHFYAVASQAMRRVLVDHARARRAAKRGGGETPTNLQLAGEPESPTTRLAPIDVLALDEALDKLAAADAAQAKLVELRFFGGLTLEEVAEGVGRSLASVNRDWRTARAFLHRELGMLTPPL